MGGRFRVHMSRVDPCLTLYYITLYYSLVYITIYYSLDDASIIIRSSVSDCMSRPEEPRRRIVVK